MKQLIFGLVIVALIAGGKANRQRWFFGIISKQKANKKEP